jgi:hypothetical protein
VGLLFTFQIKIDACIGDRKINAIQFLPLKSAHTGYRDRKGRNEE